jgi:hypothetical protein
MQFCSLRCQQNEVKNSSSMKFNTLLCLSNDIKIYKKNCFKFGLIQHFPTKRYSNDAMTVGMLRDSGHILVTSISQEKETASVNVMPKMFSHIYLSLHLLVITV